MRLVLDTNVVASGLLCGGKPTALLYAAQQGDSANNQVLAYALGALAKSIVSAVKHLPLGGGFQSIKTIRPAEAVAMLGIG